MARLGQVQVAELGLGKIQVAELEVAHLSEKSNRGNTKILMW